MKSSSHFENKEPEPQKMTKMHGKGRKRRKWLQTCKNIEIQVKTKQKQTSKKIIFQHIPRYTTLQSITTYLF